MTANEIREMQEAIIAESNNILYNKILKDIHDYAEDYPFATQMIFDTEDIPESQATAIALALNLDGYTVRILNEEGCYQGLSVSWAKEG